VRRQYFADDLRLGIEVADQVLPEREQVDATEEDELLFD
jgi:hypothetical protein